MKIAERKPVPLVKLSFIINEMLAKKSLSCKFVLIEIHAPIFNKKNAPRFLAHLKIHA